jgi:hypothetical protein
MLTSIILDKMLRQCARVSVDTSGGARPMQRATGAWKQLRQQAIPLMLLVSSIMVVAVRRTAHGQT